jgi:glucosamine--fructose-6-phosphate aminotransferase (isomerizing)
MCGIVAILSKDKKRTEEEIFFKIENTLNLVREVTKATEEMASKGLSFHNELKLSFAEMLSFEIIFYSECSPQTSAKLKELSDELSEVIKSLDKLLSKTMRLSKQEELNLLKELVLDGKWLIDDDIAGAVQSLKELHSGAWNKEERQTLNHLWQIDCCLRNIGRLEVRGRDSAGISIMATFDSKEACEKFLSQQQADSSIREEVEHRKNNADFSTFAISGGTWPGFIFAYKVAREIGHIGDNVRKLKNDIKSDKLIHTLLQCPDVQINIVAHTRWASNGVISEPNAHPLDCRTVGQSGEEGRISAVLNGDIDNYQTLLYDFEKRTGTRISSAVTTDAKIIPLIVNEEYIRTKDFEKSFLTAVNLFEGSFAIAAHHLDFPDKIYLALKGSGQSLYIGLRTDTAIVASELYGVVEVTPDFIKMDGERISENGSQGQVIILDSKRLGEERPFKAFSFDGKPLNQDVLTKRKAEITTRDICLGKWSHYFLKEVSESMASVEKTLAGRFIMPDFEKGEKEPIMLLDDKVVPPSIIDDLISGKIKKIYAIGQGTAGVAAAGVAVALEKYLGGLHLYIEAIRASELSGHKLSERMDDCLIVAVSQSGTTADTNRTVDLVRNRGAKCIAIINRRNSDLSYKSDGVLYTSNGRDVEMSVASTKAFYSQVTAGYILALFLATKTEAIGTAALCRALEALKRLPSGLEKVMSKRVEIATIAEKYAPSQVHWAIIGSGSNFVAAQEMRIKLSELCYKSIACDFVEDKKHIDLSSEPLILMCASGLDSVMLSDAVKEVAIFKAHQSVPIVFASEGSEHFKAYASAVIECPSIGEDLDYIPQVMAGHLFGFYAARAIDNKAMALRILRTEIVDAISEGTIPKLLNCDEIEKEILLNGSAAASLDPGTAVRLMLSLQYAKGELPLRNYSSFFGKEASTSEVLENTINMLTEAINQLTRPIDAIKHQAKTVTVGITREELQVLPPLSNVFKELNVEERLISRANLELLRAITPLVEKVEGATFYEIQNLSDRGIPIDSSVCIRKGSTGIARELSSRTEKNPKLKGTKWLCIKERSLFIGIGGRDGRKIAVVPLASPSSEDLTVAGLLLFHLSFKARQSSEDLVRALKKYKSQYDRIVAAATEQDIKWNDDILLEMPAIRLFDESLGEVMKSLAAMTPGSQA